MSTNNENMLKQKPMMVVLIVSGLLFSLYDGINSILDGRMWASVPNFIMVGIIVAFLYLNFKNKNKIENEN